MSIRPAVTGGFFFRRSDNILRRLEILPVIIRVPVMEKGMQRKMREMV